MKASIIFFAIILNGSMKNIYFYKLYNNHKNEVRSGKIVVH